MTYKMPSLLLALCLLAVSLYLGGKNQESMLLSTSQPDAPPRAPRPLVQPAQASADFVVVFREAPVDGLLNELEQGLGVLQVHFGPDALALTGPMETLLHELNASFRDDMHTPYDELTPAQQDLYNGVAILVADLRDLMTDIDTMMHPSSPAPLTS